MMKSMKSDYLQKIGKKAYLKTEILKLELEAGLSKYAIKHKYKLGSKLTENTWKLAKEKFPELAKKVSAEAHAKHMLGNKRGSKPPEIIVAKDKLKEALRKRFTMQEILNEFKISEFIFKRNLLYHNIKSDYVQFKKIPLKHILLKDNSIELLRQLNPEIVGLLESNKVSKENVKDIQKLFLELTDLTQAVKNIGRSFSKKYNSKLTFSSNLGCNNLCSYLYENNIEFRQEFKIENYYYDFYLPTFNMLVEVDGSYHRLNKAKANDKIKEKIAKDKGFELIRVIWTGKKIYYEGLHKAIQDKVNNTSRPASSI